MPEKVANRWALAAAGVVMQLALGAVYAWSVFRSDLSEHFDTSVTSVNIVFSIAIFTLGAAAFFGGLWMSRVGPRRVAMTAGALYGLGIFLAGLSESSIALLYLTYGLIAGAGIGLGYIVPIATLVKWFPDRRGFITGIAVAGFGAGALVTAPIAEYLVQNVGLFETFMILGALYFVMVVGAGSFMRNPPEGWTPEGWEPDAEAAPDASGAEYDIRGALRTWQWYALWGLLFLNVTAGIAILSEASPLAQEVAGASVAAGAAFVSIIAIANGAGRFLWAWLSDAIGRKNVFLTMFLLQAALFVLIPTIGTSYAVFVVLGFIVLTCYGGGFGTMPAFAADYFGSRNVGQVYGLMLTAWGTAGFVGPLLISRIRDSTGEYTLALYIIAGIMLISALLPFVVRPPKGEGPAVGGDDAPGEPRFTREPAARAGGVRP